MAKPKTSHKEVLKWKKKKWVPIMAPAMLRNATIGESLVLDANTLVGKTVEANLMALTGDMKKQHTSVKFMIDEVKDGKAMTSFVSYRLSPTTIKRSVRRRRDRIDCVFQAKTKDEKTVGMKLMLVTRDNTPSSTQTSLRKKAIALVTKRFSTAKYEDAAKDILDFKVQSELRRTLKTIYPLNTCEIRFFGLKR